jgi:hypothetical protein
MAVKPRLLLQLGGNLPENCDARDELVVSLLADAARLAGEEV